MCFTFIFVGNGLCRPVMSGGRRFAREESGNEEICGVCFSLGGSVSEDEASRSRSVPEEGSRLGGGPGDKFGVEFVCEWSVMTSF